MTDTNYSHGHHAEQKACEYLLSSEFSVVEMNWKTVWSEIDIIAKKDKHIYFVEVKYRHNNYHGTGLEYITPTKLRQMTRAAEGWVQSHNWNDDYQLAAIEVSRVDYEITEFINEAIENVIWF